LPVLLALVAFGAAAVMELSGFSSVARMSGVLAAVLAGCALAGCWRQRTAVAAGAVPALAVLPGLLFATWFNSFSDVLRVSCLLVLAAPLLLALTSVPPLARLSAGRLTLVRAGVTLLPLAAALSLAAMA
jgi:hypothetical protein